MGFRLSSSIRQLTLLGFLLVVTPLMVALISMVFQVDRLALRMQKTVRDSAQAVEASRLITLQVLSMERSAEQYGVLHDRVLLERYQTQRKQFAEALARLAALPIKAEPAELIGKLSQREQALYGRLQQWAALEQTEGQRLEPEYRLTELVRPLPRAVTEGVIADSEALNLHIERVQQLLLWQAVALIPLALVMAGIFSVLITRPLRNLGKAIRRLGAGELATPVSVSGPQDVRELAEQLDWMRQRLAELDEQKLVFLQHVSHELKTPLSAIREGTGLLQDEIVGPLNEEQTEVVKILQESSLQLQAQVEGLLNFNLALAQDNSALPQPVELAGLIDSVREKHQLAMRSRQIRVAMDLQPVRVEGVPEQLRVVIDNLLSNAIKYSPDDAVIQISLGRDKGLVCLDIIDQGVGICVAHRQQVFEPFFQGDQGATGAVKGTGLGLAIARRYVLLHRGSIQVMDSAQGAHLRVCLPAAANGEEDGDKR